MSSYDWNGNEILREWERTSSVSRGTNKRGFTRNGFKEDVAIVEKRRYNGYGQLVYLRRDTEETTYAYRPDGLRHCKKVGNVTTAHIWDGADIVADTGINGGITARYLRGLGLIAREQDNVLQYYLYNAHGDVVQRTDQAGTVLRSYDLDAYGVERGSDANDVNPFRYCGEYFDRESGCTYLRARYYDAANGRFISEDPALDGRNWFAYCYNNPVQLIDSTGCKPYTYSIKHAWYSNNLYSFTITPGWYDGMKTGMGFLPFVNPIHDTFAWALAGWKPMNSDYVSAVSSLTIDVLDNFTEWGSNWGIGNIGTALNGLNVVDTIDYLLSAEYMLDQAMYYHIKSLNNDAFYSRSRSGVEYKYNYVKDILRPYLLSGEIDVKSGLELFGTGEESFFRTYTWKRPDPLTGGMGYYCSDYYYLAKTDLFTGDDKFFSDLLKDAFKEIKAVR